MTSTKHDTGSTPGAARAARPPRAIAAQVVAETLWRGRLLDRVLEDALAGLVDRRRAALIQEMCYGTLRWAVKLRGVTDLLLSRPLNKKDRDVLALLMVGLYQLMHMDVKIHAAVNETVAAADALGKPWAKNLINACLRGYLRRRADIEENLQRDPETAYNHPAWLLEKLRQAWPAEWERIVQANDQHAPMGLRVNLRRNTRRQYQAALEAAGIAATTVPETDCGLRLDAPQPVAALPGFIDGSVSVQDTAAQLAAIWLDTLPGQRVLDACAAPGGKTAHILERTPALAELIAVDIDPGRLELIRESLERLGLEASLVQADAAAKPGWWDGRPFDRVLVDAPCSATGVIRRHPDIKAHRSPAQVSAAVRTQSRILARLWPLLRRGGKLLYVTCSVLPEENERQMVAFLEHHPDAREVAIGGAATASHRFGRPRPVGLQILPGDHDMDGFYYACIEKD